jgi:hypothetical protein
MVPFERRFDGLPGPPFEHHNMDVAHSPVDPDFTVAIGISRAAPQPTRRIKAPRNRTEFEFVEQSVKHHVCYRHLRSYFSAFFPASS